jgi:hypothetical protein
MLARLIALAAVLMAGAVAMTACTARAGVSGWSPSLQASFASLGGAQADTPGHNPVDKPEN